MRGLRALIACFAVGFGGGVQAEGVAGEFDYWVMALSWQPSWCANDGAGSDQCERPAGWTLHGLWPQYERGWPSYCPTAKRPPTRSETGAMADIMGSGGLAWHQWRKHGVCSGLDGADYLDLSREMYGRVVRPELLRQLRQEVQLPAHVIEEAFLADNPQLEPDGITITCKAGRIAEARICFSRDLEPVLCAADVVRDCTANDALFAPIE
ncbi:ribonuclease T2 family protein [Aestuariibius sp. 2305UL40-4]|uniref:ribonuclease T2 family protein n=1 Tax=Aestuariibius violaceus TaxID=3234132 RepID=UPI00345EF4D2